MQIYNEVPSSPLFFIFLVLLLLFPSKAMVDRGEYPPPTPRRFKGSIGAIIDYSSHIGKEEKIAMEMAIEDFYNTTNHRPFLHVRDSRREPVRAVLAAMDLINKQQVQAILGLRTWEETSLVADLGNRVHVPIISFAEATPPWASQRWPFLVRASHSQAAQMGAVAAIVASWGWRKVTFVYEDIDSIATNVIPHLATLLRKEGSEIDHLVALPPFASSSSLSQELVKLQSKQCRVFVLHSSPSLATRLFIEANKIEMMAKGYVWIITDSVTNLVHSFNASIISSMQGIVGVKSHFPQTGARFRDFSDRFRSRFRSDHLVEENLEPGIFAVQAYDAIWAVALAMEGRIKVKNTKNSKHQLGLEVSKGGQQLLQGILHTDFDGLTGKVCFKEWQSAPAHTFQIVNVVGKSYRELGFWTEGEGFSVSIDDGDSHNTSMRVLGQVFWPGGPWAIPRGWALPTTANPLRIGVPAKPAFNQFVNVKYDNVGEILSITGFAIDVFNATVEQLPYHLPYKFIPYEGIYDSLVEQVHLKVFDAVVGDIAIIAKRCQHAEFSHPYTEPGLVMVVTIQSKTSNRRWLFMKPFTKSMWTLTVFTNIYNGFVIWMIERNHYSQMNGSLRNQIGIMLWLSFTTLFSLQGERLHSNLSRMAIVVWLFVALVITQSYTASLTSMLTVQRLEPTVTDVESLRNSNAIVGCSGRSYSAKYLEEVLHFDPNNIKKIYSSKDYPQALRTGEIAAAFIESPYANLFVAKYCRDFAIAGPTYKIGGFGFAFPKGSSMVPDISEAILKVSESGRLRELENKMIFSSKCSNVSSYDDQGSLSLQSFGVLFVFTGGISTIALALFVFPMINWHLKDSIGAILTYKSMRKLILVLMKHVGVERANPSEELTIESHGHGANVKT
ncbi:hypothetical protein HHK36_023588 [Tetracentron sinense]|uniref:Glutamate receptor n=1 Tax=Tetracentron sinense TaxID=13715 RepID=A0A834YQI9_TETSI|nr:hypothetical protein HHK36_023588 [Tetracentron sinense]